MVIRYGDPTAQLGADQLPTGVGVVIGKHTGELFREDFPSLNVAAGEPWWRPRHVRAGVDPLRELARAFGEAPEHVDAEPHRGEL